LVILFQESVPWDIGKFVLREELESLLDSLGEKHGCDVDYYPGKEVPHAAAY